MSSFNKPTLLDLFSGIGGFSLGLERAGFQTVSFCESDLFCKQVLSKHWPVVPIIDTIEEVKQNECTFTASIISAGFPCQPFSKSGQRKGQKDHRYLWPETLRIIKEFNPSYILLENVLGLVSLGLDQVLLDLENNGYTPWTLNIPACAVNAPHTRERLWVLAYSNKIQRKWWSTDSKKATWQPKSSEKFLSRFLFPRSWPTLSSARTYRERYGIPRRLDSIRRNGALGNSVVPYIPEMIGRAILPFF